MPVSRLDRLVTLLDTGSTQLIRTTAAQQLADIQKKHPDELFNLLTRVVPHLKSKNWETRTSAAKAVGGIVENGENFDPNVEDHLTKYDDGSLGKEGFLVKEEESDGNSFPDDQLQLETLDVAAIMSQGKKLLASAGQEYDYVLAGMDAAQRLVHQKKSLNARLGLGGVYTEDDLISESDFKNQREPVSPGPGLRRLNTAVQRSNSVYSAAGSVGSPYDSTMQTPTDETGLSKRQLNMLKRKKKLDLKFHANKVHVIDLADRRLSMNGTRTPYIPEPIAIKKEELPNDSATDSVGYFSLDRQNGNDDSMVMAQFKESAPPGKSDLQPEAEEEGVDWPYERLCDYLMVDMFDHNWEIRHGAAMGLREVIRVQGAGAGRARGKTQVQNDVSNQRWLNDIACRLCCIFMLDRFGDYVSDNVVAPIRETAGQTLGALLQYMSPSSVKDVYRILYRLVMQEDLHLDRQVWQACHGGMIGMRYLVAVRKDLFSNDKDLMNGVVEAVMKGLGDMDDDVRASSAATLIPVSEELVKLQPLALNRLVISVWDCLSELSDDLSASTGSVMDLLAKLCSFPKVLRVMESNAAQDQNQSFTQLVPRLYPFLRHTVVSVRSAVLRALLTFIHLENEDTKDWVDGRILRLVFQNILVERSEQVLQLSLEVWIALLDHVSREGPHKLAAALEPHLDPMLALALHPMGISRDPRPMNPSLFMRPSGQVLALQNYGTATSSPSSKGDPLAKRRRKSQKAERNTAPSAMSTHNIDGPMIGGDMDLVGEDVMIRSKTMAAQALGKLMSLWPASSRLVTFASRIIPNLQSPFSMTRFIAARVAEEFAIFLPNIDELGHALATALQPLIEDELPPTYADLVSSLKIVLAHCNALQHLFVDVAHIPKSRFPEYPAWVEPDGNCHKHAFKISYAERVIGRDFERLKSLLTPVQRKTLAQQLDDIQSDFLRVIQEFKVLKEQRDVRVKAGAAAALVALQSVAKKPSSTIKGLMDSVKTEENSELQGRSAAALILLVKHMVLSERRVVVDKVVGNLTKFYCTDTAETPDFDLNVSQESSILSLQKDEAVQDYADAVQRERESRAARLQRRGARTGLEQLCHQFGESLFDHIPALASLLEAPLKEAFAGEFPMVITSTDNNLGQQVIDAMSTCRALVPKLHAKLHPFVLKLVPYIISALRSKFSVLRYAAAKCLATICSVITVEGFSTFVKKVLPSISSAHDVYQRQGAIESIYHLIHVMEDHILPYVIFLIVPVLGRMSDSDNDVRLIATTAFATLVKLVPLEAGIPDPPGLSEDLLRGRERERKFMSQMLDFKKVEPFDIPVTIKATLRSYQQEGVNWLAFLNRYHLHGILCDDMGLGKTLQTLCIVASDHHMRAEEYTKTQHPDVRKLPSLIVCPPTLSGHWQQEIRTYAPFLNAVAYVGSSTERAKARGRMESADVVITSYEICRNDIAVLAPITWNYCVLDEGHLIKNPAAKTSIAVKTMISNHRLILSGTPIQNNVLELWSLFDFLMPGFLGTEKVFRDRFAKPIAASRFGKSSSKEQEAGALAIEALHKQVLPFLLRRLKEEVLDDLPPKIIQNYYCDLSDLQKKLFEDFTKKEGKALSEMATSGDKQAKQHIFVALNYMRKLCNSPTLVMREGHKQYDAIQAYLKRQGTHLRDPVHAPKLGALRDLLVDCGIGTAMKTKADEQTTLDTEAVSQHRALIFCQMKEMLDIVQNDVLGKLLPNTTFLRLDGTVEANKRQDIVNKFNSDPSIDVLLLTTSVGGLGLNLTGADTVIFVEHDWNPQKDIQAMDRAHRIGQKKVVNVYRLITRGTLEEKIMSLQRFKIDVASTVVNQQNAGLATMETDQILDLFNLGPNAEMDGEIGMEGADAVDVVTGEVKEKGKKGFLDGIGELWDEKQYEEEYNLDEFLQKMKA